MFSAGAFNPVAMGFQYPGQQPAPNIYQSQYGGFNPQMTIPFQQVAPPPRGQSLPASARHYPPLNGSYAPNASRPYDQYPPPVPSHQQQQQRKKHGTTNKKRHKQRKVSSNGVTDQGLYSDKEKTNQKESDDLAKTQSSTAEAAVKQDETVTNGKNTDQENQPEPVDNATGNGDGENSQATAVAEEDKQKDEEKKKRKSRSKKKKHNRHDYDERYNYNNNFPSQAPQPPPLFGELPPHMRVHQQPLYQSYNQAYEESIRRGDVYQKQAKRSTRLPPEAKQKLLPHEDDQQKPYPIIGYPPQAFADMHQPFNPYQPYPPRPNYFAPTNPYTGGIPPWPNNGGVHSGEEHKIDHLRNHIHTLENQLHKLQKKLNKTSLNNHNEAGTKEQKSRKHRRSKRDNLGTPRQTPVIVELNNGNNDNVRESSSKKHQTRTEGDATSPKTFDKNQQETDTNERSNVDRAGETEVKPFGSRKSSREETAARLAHAAAAHVNARQQAVPPPPPLQQQYSQQQGVVSNQTQQNRGQTSNISTNDNTSYSNEQNHQRTIPNPNFNQSNNNELLENGEPQRNRSVEKILDAFERFYMKDGISTTMPMKIKYIPEDSNSNNYRQRNTNNNNRYRSASRSSQNSSSSSSSATWSSSDGLSSGHLH